MTIYALSSGPGVSGIAVIRISGSKVEEIVKLITNDQLPKPRQATLKKFNKINNSELIDEGILIGRAQLDLHLTPKKDHHFMFSGGILEDMF